ncbi:MAG: sugar-binding transcriptional regulator [Acetobacteraceae bacterium]
MQSEHRSQSDPAEQFALATRAAWLYHASGLTQAEIAERLGISNAKAHRLIAHATHAGWVRVFVEGPIGGCVALEQALAREFGLRFCRVVPNEDASVLPLQVLGVAGAAYLINILEKGDHRIIGVGHGRTLAAAVERLPRLPAPNVSFVSLLGTVARQSSANPFEVIHRLAEKTGAESWMLPVPFIVNSRSDRDIVLAQRGIAEAMQIAAGATLCLVGIGEVAGDAFITASGMISQEEVAELLALGAVGEVLGHYLDADGRPVPTRLHDRILSFPFEQLRARDVIALAGGGSKPAAIRSVLRSGALSGLITDQPTAQSLINLEEPMAGATAGRNKHVRESTRSL